LSRALDDLDARFRPLAIALIARCCEAGVPVMIIETRRTAEEQRRKIAQGVSWVEHSKHEDGLAIDICPYQTYQIWGAAKLDWNAGDPVWQTVGRIGEALGLRWGGRWKQRDMGHFEMADAARQVET